MKENKPMTSLSFRGRAWAAAAVIFTQFLLFT